MSSDIHLEGPSPADWEGLPVSVQAMLAMHRPPVLLPNLTYRAGMVLAEHAGNDGLRAWPSVATIAQEVQAVAAKKSRAVQYALRNLVRLRLFLVERAGGRGPKDPTVYVMNAHCQSRAREVDGQIIRFIEVVWNADAGVAEGTAASGLFNALYDIALPADGESMMQHLGQIVCACRLLDSGAARSSNLCTATHPPGGCRAIVRPVDRLAQSDPGPASARRPALSAALHSAVLDPRRGHRRQLLSLHRNFHHGAPPPTERRLRSALEARANPYLHSLHPPGPRSERRRAGFPPPCGRSFGRCDRL